ncbi:PrsW family glutamic-type intramembrane protease [Thermosynechococcaceae cyanobacterium BACA0444]|uniref:PrsW family glutamic-type intramembrane protease n=1 Tax=Pseudocalidococcus azoricus BACA0444 TaxID=2918990 RepID=A0AAE4FTY9_9CYAN|nr:PrsW family glutamic-type intramembrane protease [Pseudocalidococcus azoricus]MDS3861532.1 PrsW family glutamic-type intramembrane protease [Pseudocalidococcus azoricus BACA0444]
MTENLGSFGSFPRPGQGPLLRQVSPETQDFWLSTSASTLIGRDPQSCQVVLDSQRYGAVSRHHVSLRPGPGATEPWIWQIEDLNSINGTFLNHRRITAPHVLTPGDRFRLGTEGPEFEFNYIAATEIPATLTRPPVSTLTLSQLMPLLAAGQDLARKAYLMPGMVTVLAVILLFMTTANGSLFKVVLAVYLGLAGYYFIYQLCGKPKPIWVLAAAVILEILLIRSPITLGLAWFFRQVLPGTVNPSQMNFGQQFIGYFFGAGLLEELLKAIPVLMAWGLGRLLRSPRREQIGVWEPLDGILLATAAALGFTWLETLGQYVPNLIAQTGDLTGLQVLIPRVLGSVAGHMAYSGYFGYCIGLAVLYPRQRWFILGLGWFVAALIHALWNTSATSFGPLGLVGVGILAYALLTATILKARQLSPTRALNFATRFYDR